RHHDGQRGQSLDGATGGGKTVLAHRKPQCHPGKNADRRRSHHARLHPIAQTVYTRRETMFDFLSDETEQTTTRFVTFITPALNRFDLAITTTDRFYGKKLVTDLQRNITGVIGPDDLREEGVLASVFR